MHQLHHTDCGRRRWYIVAMVAAAVLACEPGGPLGPLPGNTTPHYSTASAIVIDFDDFVPADHGLRFGEDLVESHAGFDWAYDEQIKIDTWGSWTVQDVTQNGIAGAGGSDNWLKARAADVGKGAKITRQEGFWFESMKLFTDEDKPAFLDAVEVTWRASDGSTSAGQVVDLVDDQWITVTAAALGVEDVELKAIWFNAIGITDPDGAKFGLDDLAVMFAQPGPPDGLVAYYPLDNDAADASGNGHHGILGATTQTGLPGVIDGALGFDGTRSSIVSVPTDPAFRFNGAYAVSGWFNITSFPAGYETAKLIGQTTGNEWTVSIDQGLILRSQYEHGNDVDDIVLYPLPQNVFGKWHHFVAQYNDVEGVHELYFDGIRVAFEAQPAPEINSTSPINIGGDQHTDIRGLVGMLDELRVHDRPLSRNEISDLFIGGSPPLAGEVVDFAQSTTPDGTLVFFTDAGEVYEVRATDLDIVIRRSASGPHGIVAVTTNRFDNSIFAVTATADFYRFSSANDWRTATFVTSIANVTDMVDLVQQPGAPDADIVAITASGTVFEIDPTGAAVPAQRASGVIGQSAAAVAANDRDGGIVAIASNGHIFRGDPASSWAQWPFLNSLGNNLTGVEDFVQAGSGTADFPVVRTDGGNLCWWDPRNHFTCTGSDLPGNVAAIGFNAVNSDVLVALRDGAIYRRADPPTFTMWVTAGSLTN